MKYFKSLSLVCLISTFCFSANAIPSFPRDLKCTTSAGVEITLKSNNSLWTQSQNSRYKVTLDVDGNVDMPTSWTNNRATHTRGNDTGVREYIFNSLTGESFFVTLEFTAPFGKATGIKSFRVRSNSIQFDHTQSSLRGDVCNVTFYSRTNI